jgi:hypothetical protein
MQRNDLMAKQKAPLAAIAAVSTFRSRTLWSRPLLSSVAVHPKYREASCAYAPENVLDFPAVFLTCARIVHLGRRFRRLSHPS